LTLVERIVAGELDAAVVYSSEAVIAFLDHDPINHGHLLICPKHPYKDFIDVPEPIMNEMLNVARTLYRKLIEKYEPEGISFIQNNGECNELDHYHLHIFPRMKGDQFGWTSKDLGIQSIEQLVSEAAGLFVRADKLKSQIT
jgi:histidine triad (HIT) family protein